MIAQDIVPWQLWDWNRTGSWSLTKWPSVQAPVMDTSMAIATATATDVMPLVRLFRSVVWCRKLHRGGCQRKELGASRFEGVWETRSASLVGVPSQSGQRGIPLESATQRQRSRDQLVNRDAAATGQQQGKGYKICGAMSASAGMCAGAAVGCRLIASGALGLGSRRYGWLREVPGMTSTPRPVMAKPPVRQQSISLRAGWSNETGARRFPAPVSFTRHRNHLLLHSGYCLLRVGVCSPYFL